MFVKVYRYQIQEDKINHYLEIQQKVLKIYKEQLNIEVIYLQNQISPVNWIEMAFYKCEKEEYRKKIKLINEQNEIQEYFNAFQATLIPGTEIVEEEYRNIPVVGQ
ncbi:hypothetical protein [Lysinibacillus sp. SGAir0095]|uniref:hypothetical protein n=1 Tax=Lysinibacillus sp. SGAir0095 TaxID=2070463 RepID=UPI0010CCEAB7|nr:hypothetical protein [Lysinibacillus sp. SGAir0095]QCR32737.1 hypothetical protein C1N55_11385 [Lysinibacillus sp. SGAir0095]